MEEGENIASFILLGTTLLLIIVATLIIYTLYYQRKNLLLKNSIAKIEKEKQLELFTATIATQENERKRIATDIHDGVGPYLTVLRARLDYYNQQLNDTQPNTEIVNDVELIDYCIDTIRDACKELHPAFLIDFGFYKAIKHFTQKLNSEVTTVTFNELHVGEPPNLQDQFSINLFRVYQEVVNNILKHAKASTIRVTCQASINKISIIFYYNGIKFTNDDANTLIQKNKGLGLMNIYSRLKVLNGDIDYFVNEGGVCIKITVLIK